MIYPLIYQNESKTVLRDQIVLYSTADSLRSNSPQLRYQRNRSINSYVALILRIVLTDAHVDWYCARPKKQGHRIRVETSSLTLLLRFDREEDSLVWFETIQTTISEYKTWIQNNHPSPTSPISGPFNVTKTSTEELFQILTTPPKEDNRQNKKLGRKGSLSNCPC